MAFYRVNSSEGTTDFEWIGGIDDVISVVYNMRYYNGATQNHKVTSSGGTSYDGSVTCVSISNSVATYRFNTAGRYLVNNTWKDKTANSTETMTYNKGILWFSDHKQH